MFNLKILQAMKTTRTLITLAVIAFVFSSCAKFEDGPKISLKSKKSRIAQEWELKVLYNADGEEQAVVPEWTMDYSKEGDYNTSVYGFEQEGTWAFDGDVNLKITYEISGLGATYKSYENYEILRLASDELWLIDKNESHTGTYNYELQFKIK